MHAMKQNDCTGHLKHMKQYMMTTQINTWTSQTI